MTTTAFFLILFSVFLHVSWNLMSKASRPSAAFYLIVAIDAAIVMVPFLCCAEIAWTALPPRFWGYFLAAGAANVIYYVGLFLAYRHGEVSLVYPMARALPVVLTAVVTIACGIGKTPSPTALAGMVLVSCGCLLMPLARWSQFRLKNYLSPALGGILLAACGTTGYTICDSVAIKLLFDNSVSHAAVTSCAYMAIVEILIALALAFFLFRADERQNFRLLFTRSLLPHLSGVFTVAAYILVLLAMPRVTNVCFVQVFRQMGLPLGVFAGMLLLHEKCSSARLTGVAVIVLGLILTVIK